MSTPLDTKSNTVGDNSQNTTNQEPPPPYTPPEQGGGGSSTTNSIRAIPPEQGGGGSSTTNSIRAITVPYDGGATERTFLISQQQSSYTSPSPQYTPITNLHYSPGGHVPRFQASQPVALRDLTDRPAWTTCPHCNDIVLSKPEYESGCCTFLSCLGLCILGGTTICSFIPFCFNVFKDTVHYCPKCRRVMARVSRLNHRVS